MAQKQLELDLEVEHREVIVGNDPKVYEISKVAQRRYYMNRILRENNIDFDSKRREIKLPYRCFEDIPIGLRFYIGQCIRLKYNVQYEIFDHGA